MCPDRPVPARSGVDMRHFIAVNCHPFHDPTRLAPCLDSVLAAVEALDVQTQTRIHICVFCHGFAPQMPHQFLDMVEINTDDHRSNGENLNLQLTRAIDDGFDTFFRVDGDDIVAPQRFCAQIALLERGGVDLVGAGLTYQTASGQHFDVMPSVVPRPRAYVENQFMLHPTMALRLTAAQAAKLRYWPARLEDKAFVLRAYRAGLRVENVPILAGTYFVGPKARRDFRLKWLGLQLNTQFLVAARAWYLLPYALVLFLGQIMIGSGKMRQIRHLISKRSTVQAEISNTSKTRTSFKSILSITRF